MGSEPIHVLHVTTRLSAGGVQSFLINYAEHMDNKKIVFDVAVQSTEPQRYDCVIKSMGGRIFYVRPMTTSKMGFFLDIYRICKENPELKTIHAHLNYRNFIPLLAAKCAKVPVRISHSHSAYEAKSKMKKVARWIYQAFLPTFASEYWGCSKKANEWLYGKNRRNMVVVHNAIDAVAYRFSYSIRESERTQLRLEDKDIAIAHVGTFGEAKNHIFMLRMFASYLKKHENARLILCGDGSNREKIEKEISTLHIEKHVNLLGMISNVRDILMAADVFILPSLFEGLPLSVVEAQASGVACVVSNAVPLEAIFAPNSVICDGFDIDTWISKIDDVRAINCNRVEAYKLTEEAGYDIISEAKKLKERYVELQ